MTAEATHPAATEVGALTGAFLRRTRRDLGALWALIARIEAGNVGVLPDIELTAHSIHGTAALFGFSRLSAAGGALERCARTDLVTTTPPARDPHLVQRLKECTAALALEADSAERGGPQRGGLFDG